MTQLPTYPNVLSTMEKRLAKEKTFLAPYILEEETTHCWKLRTPNNWLIEFQFASYYPFSAPSIRILEPVGILPRLGICGCQNGTICISGFLGQWGPSWTVKRMLEYIEQTIEKTKTQC